MLGISFPLTWSVSDFADAGSLNNYNAWQDAVDSATSGGRFMAPLDSRPTAHTPLEFANNAAPPVTAARAAAFSFAAAAPNTEGTPEDDILSVSSGGPYHFNGYGGNDDITGSDGGDVIDGGTGDDVMSGGRGNDTYYVDSAGDLIIEDGRGGFDRVISSIDYALGDFVEHVALTGAAVAATGNSLRNTLEGNGLDNTLSGGEGDDTLAGNGGDDILIGGAGGDGYVYDLGDGHDTIIDAAAPGDDNVIVLAGSFDASDIEFLRDPAAMNDLVLRFTDGGSITVLDYFAGATPNITGVEFSSGASWSDAELQVRAAATMLSSNMAPIAQDDAFVYANNGAFALPGYVFLGNDRDLDGDALTITAVSNVSGGTVVLDGAGGLSFTPDPSGLFAFDYSVTDGNGGQDTAHAEIAFRTVNGNTAPRILTHMIASVTEDTPAAGSLSTIDDNGDLLIYGVKAGAGPSKGNISFVSDGTFVYTPNANANGADHFTLTVTDGFSTPVEQVFDVTIAAVNDAPVARDDTGLTVKSGATLRLTTASLLANDGDADGDILQLLAAGPATGGMLKRASNGDILFTGGKAGDAAFTYVISDGHGGTGMATTHITVTAQSKNVIAGTDTAETLTGTNGNDIFDGMRGNDVLIGKAGNDIFRISGDAGLDTIFGGGGHDTILGGAGADILRVKSYLTNVNSVECLDGGSGRDTILATAGNDVLDLSNLHVRNFEEINLGAGNDVIQGSAEANIFRGGTGNDTFIFRPGSSSDTILDFEVGYAGSAPRDLLDLRGNHIASRFELFHMMHQEGADTVIVVDASTQIRLTNISVQTLLHGNFVVL